MSYSQYEPPQGPPYGSSPYGGPPLYQAPRATNGLAIASMVVSLVAVGGALLMCGVGGIFGIAGAIMGHVARGQIRRDNAEGDGFALAGIIVGWVTFAVGLLAVIAFVVFVIAVGHSVETPYGETGSSV
ncbi:MAG TPA: DUF4190 domain-containing protein [Nocardioides sp.]|nr:DUF4190 domain-containing protein [Nocardioides sp.]